MTRALDYRSWRRFDIERWQDGKWQRLARRTYGTGSGGETRAKLMGLLDTFDLDYVMTSEREWGCYPTVPSLAIYQLASRPELNAVHVTRWVWNGKEKVREK